MRPTGHITIQITVTYTHRGHHILHRLNLRDDTHLLVIEQHYPQFFTLKKFLKIALAYTRPYWRSQQLPFTNPVYSETVTPHNPHSSVFHFTHECGWIPATQIQHEDQTSHLLIAQGGHLARTYFAQRPAMRQGPHCITDELLN
jgi:hypothetical protein